MYSGYKKVEVEENRRKMEKAWGVERLPGNYGLTLIEQIEECGRVKAMYILGENPMLSFPDINMVKKGLESLGFLVVQDIFMTDTARLGNFFGLEYRPLAEAPDAEYPFAIMTGRLLYHYHTGTMTRRSPTLNKEIPTGFVEINDQDAAAIGIKKGVS